MKGQLEIGYLDAFYGHSKGGVTRSGWSCKNLPYLVEFDNFGISNHPGKAELDNHFAWGYDEITWFSKLLEKERNAFLEYAYEWVPAHDPAGYLQMPGNRKITPGDRIWGKIYRANNQTDQFPYGYSQGGNDQGLWR